MQQEEGCDRAVCHSNPRGAVCVQDRLRGALGSSAQLPSHTMTSWHHRQAVNLSTARGSDSKGEDVGVFNQVQAQGSPSDVMPGKENFWCYPSLPRGGSPGPVSSCHLCASAPKKLTHHREISTDYLRLELQRETINSLLRTRGFLELGWNSSGSSIAKERRGNQAPHLMLFAHNIIKLLPSGLF